ncbi:MAG TPA: endonuclease domain-containing protein, partial [Pyrinomonadaceae bacterium]
TQVKTQDGWKKIEIIQRGEVVWTHRNRLRPVIGVQPHPHVGRIIGIRVQGSTETIWMTPSQRLLSPSPHAERGKGGEDAMRVDPTPTPSPQAGRGDVQRRLGGTRGGLWKLGRELKKNSTGAEKLLWNELRGQKLGIKFRRQHSLGNYIADFYAPDALLAIELDGSVHDSDRQKWADGIRHRQIGQAGVRILRFRNERVLHDLKAVLDEIRHCISPSPQAERGNTTAGPYFRNAGDLKVGDEIILNERGHLCVVESVESTFTNEMVYDLIVGEDQSFITAAGIACE